MTILEKYRGGPVGVNTIAASISEEADTIEEVYEPYLIQLGFLNRTPRGRVATELAYDYFNVKRKLRQRRSAGAVLGGAGTRACRVHTHVDAWRSITSGSAMHGDESRRSHKIIYLGMGSNIGDRDANLQDAIKRLAAADLNIIRVSPVYETEPVDYTDQRWFLNLVVEAEISLPDDAAFPGSEGSSASLAVSAPFQKGPRTIDIDILLYGKAIVRTTRLEIPHPRMGDRRFVLAPLADLSPELRHPVTHQTIRLMLEAAPPQVVRRLHS